MNGQFTNFGGFGGFDNGENGQVFGGFNKEDFAEKFRKQKNNLTGGKKILLGIVIGLIVLLALLGAALNFIMDIWQIKEIGAGYDTVFWKSLFTKLAVSSSGFVVVFVLALINLFLVRRLALAKHLENRLFKKKYPYIITAFVVSALFGGIMGQSSYLELLTAMNATDFGVVDPLFSKDISYYIFVRPFLSTIVNGLKDVFLFQTIAVALIYYVSFYVSGTKKIKEMITQEKGALTHILVNILIYYIMMIFSYRLTAENLMYGTFGKDGLSGAGFIEANIWLNYYKFAPYILLLAVILAVFFIWRKKFKLTLVAVLVIPAVYIMVTIVAFITQQLVVAPDERTYQTSYIEHNMNATKAGFGLENIEEVQFDFSQELTADAIAQNSAELTNTRIIDFSASLTAYNQLQYLRKYYTFNDIDVVPYEIDGELTGAFMSARELNKDNLEETARSYTNEKFRYTHGFGVVASPIDRVTEDGQPYFCMKDIPVVSTNGMPELTQPRIYYGESTNDYVIVGSDNLELDYSEGYTDVEYTYTGDSGVKLSFFKKLMFSLYYRDYKMFFSGNIDSESKILINRNVMDRVRMVAPFLMYEEDPQVVVDDNGEIKWIIDAYTYSDKYPFAQNFNGVNYIRNSVKAVVDAYTGNIKFYIIDDADPVVNTYKKIYPKLFTDEAFPENLASHITTPEGLFKLQTQVYQRYHLEDAGQFYDQADVWRVATEKYENDEIVVNPYFNIFTIEGETKPELVLNMPYVLGDKYNMVGILMKRTDIDHYGELVLYRIPKSDTVYGPMQIENKIDNDPDISREMTLWGQGGSTVIRGNLLVIPFKNSIFYVEPVYITSQNNASLPEIKRIIVAYKDAVVMAPTLEEALSQVIKSSDGMNTGNLLDVPQTTPDDEGTSTIPEAVDYIKEVVDAYDAFRKSSGQNNWQQMGKDLEKLDDAINNIR